MRLQGNNIFAEQVKEGPPKNLAFSESKLNELSGSDIFGDAQQVPAENEYNRFPLGCFSGFSLGMHMS